MTTKHTPWDYVTGRTLIHIETANLGDGSPCGEPVCSLPKSKEEVARRIVDDHNALLGIANPPEALREARDSLEFVATFFAGSVPHCPEETALVRQCAHALRLLTPEQES